MNFLVRLGAGFCVSSAALCIFAGGVQAAFQILALSIVCTAGIGLAFWIPLWWAVGWGTIAIVELLISKGASELASARKPAVPRTERALMTFIRQAEASGMNQDAMVRRLQSVGWDLAEIQKARQRVESSTSSA